MKKIKIQSRVIDIVAPGSSVPKPLAIQVFKMMKSLGWAPRFYGSLKSSSPFFAQEEREAVLNFKKAILAKDSSMIWCLRGGYGCMRLLAHLKNLKNNSFPKLFIGHSDATVLHDWVHHNLSWPSLHFPVLTAWPELSGSSKKKLQSLIEGKTKKCIQFAHLKVLNPQKKWSRTPLTGKITGGNLTVIQSLIGTRWSVSRKNQILFLEDVHEKPYRIHRALWQLGESGVLQNVKALVFGRWLEKSQFIENRVLRVFAEKCSFPVLTGLPCGHGRVSHPLPLGGAAKLLFQKDQAVLEVTSFV